MCDEKRDKRVPSRGDVYKGWLVQPAFLFRLPSPHYTRLVRLPRRRPIKIQNDVLKNKVLYLPLSGRRWWCRASRVPSVWSRRTKYIPIRVLGWMDWLPKLPWLYDLCRGLLGHALLWYRDNRHCIWHSIPVRVYGCDRVRFARRCDRRCRAIVSLFKHR